MCTEKENWPFDQPKDCAVITLKAVMANNAPILWVYHDLDDHGWQFLSTNDFSVDDAMVVSLENMIQRDPSLFTIADIQPGYHAYRATKNEDWIIVQT